MKLSLQFFPRDGIYGVGVEVGGCPGGPRDRGVRPTGGRPLSRGQALGPLVYFLAQKFLLIPKSASVDFQDIL